MRIILSWSGVAGTTGLGETRRRQVQGHSSARNDSPSGWLRKVQEACSGGQYSERRFRYATWLISLVQSAGCGLLLIVRHRVARLLREDLRTFSPSGGCERIGLFFRRYRKRFADRRRATRITAAVVVKPGRAHQAVRRILQGWIPLNSSWRFETALWRTQFVHRVIDQWLWIG